MPRGGPRVGSGRKPDGPAAIASLRGAPRVSAIEAQALAEPPADLPSDMQRAFWRAWAPHAIAQHTLVPETVAGFRELCEQIDVKAALFAQMQQDGIASPEGERCLKRWEKVAQRVDASMARFRLTAFGKPMDGARSTTPKANPWGRIIGHG